MRLLLLLALALPASVVAAVFLLGASFSYLLPVLHQHAGRQSAAVQKLYNTTVCITLNSLCSAGGRKS